MRWSLRIARLAGISIYIHITFLILPLWIGFTDYSVRQSWADAWMGVAFTLVLFGIVVLHELGHAVTARRFGIRTQDITLLPIGGVARLERMPEEPRQELLVALAGPAVNVALAAILFAVLGAGSRIAWLTNLHISDGGFLVTLMWVNIALAVFNLIPAFPMDGGRVLRALLALRMTYLRATTIAARVGQTLALVFGFIGLWSIFFGRLGPISNPFLLFIGLFVWMGAKQEAGMVVMKSALGKIPVAEIMIREFRSVSPESQLIELVDSFFEGWQKDFPVLIQGKPIGVLSATAIVEGLAAHGKTASAVEVMRRDFMVLDVGESAEKAVIGLRGNESRVVLVLDGGQLRGIITEEQLNTFLLLRSVLPDWHRRPLHSSVELDRAAA